MQLELDGRLLVCVRVRVRQIVVGSDMSDLRVTDIARRWIVCPAELTFADGTPVKQVGKSAR